MSVNKQNNFLITGGSTGLGFSIAHKLLKDGHKVICTTRDLSKLTKEAKSLEQLGCKWLSLDLSSSASINEMLKNALDALNGHIDVLINGAAYALMGAFEDTPLQKLRDQFEVNFFSVFSLTQKVLPIMREQKNGVIVNISSIAGQHALPSATAYASSKHALEGMTEALMQEVAPLGIRVLLIEPGAFRTEFLSSKNFQTISPSQPYKDNPAGTILQKYNSAHGTQQGDPDKAANLIVQAIYTPHFINVNGVEKPLFRLPIGQDCLDRLKGQATFLHSTIEQLGDKITSTNH